MDSLFTRWTTKDGKAILGSEARGARVRATKRALGEMDLPDAQNVRNLQSALMNVSEKISAESALLIVAQVGLWLSAHNYDNKIGDSDV